MHSGTITFGQMSVGDADYLFDLSEVTMRGYVEEVWGQWNESESKEFLTNKLHCGEFESILESGQQVGVVSVVVHDTHYQLEQLYVEPAHQNRGLGEAVVRIVLVKAVANLKPVRLRVLKPNPAKRLYERLGFVVTKATRERYFMEHYP